MKVTLVGYEPYAKDQVLKGYKVHCVRADPVQHGDGNAVLSMYFDKSKCDDLYLDELYRVDMDYYTNKYGQYVARPVAFRKELY